jgi:hypothetical protein
VLHQAKKFRVILELTNYVYILSILIAAGLTSCTSQYSEADAGADAAYNAINAYGEKAAKNHDWELFGIGGSFYDHVRKLNLSFSVYQEVDITEARKMIVTGVEELLKDANANKKLIPYMIQHPFTYENLRFSISLLDPTTERHFPSGAIAHVSLQNGRVYYSITDETNQWLKDKYEESYPETYKIVTGHDLPNSSETNAPLSTQQEN